MTHALLYRFCVLRELRFN